MAATSGPRPASSPSGIPTMSLASRATATAAGVRRPTAMSVPGENARRVARPPRREPRRARSRSRRRRARAPARRRSEISFPCHDTMSSRRRRVCAVMRDADREQECELERRARAVGPVVVSRLRRKLDMAGSVYQTSCRAARPPNGQNLRRRVRLAGEKTVDTRGKRLLAFESRAAPVGRAHHGTARRASAGVSEPVRLRRRGRPEAQDLEHGRKRTQQARDTAIGDTHDRAGRSPHRPGWAASSPCIFRSSSRRNRFPSARRSARPSAFS